jgi:AcrR family transcriptional regulator
MIQREAVQMKLGEKNSSSRSKSSSDTASRIVAAATSLFAVKGFKGVSIKDISETAGVNIAAVNYHFNSKENLFLHIIEQFLSELFVSARKTLVSPINAVDLNVRLEIFVRQTIEAIIRQPDVISIIQREMARSNSIFQKTILKHRESLIIFLHEAKTNGLIAPDVDASFAAEYLMGQIAQASRRDSIKKDLFGRTPAAEKFRDHWIQQTLRLFFGGIMTK